MELALSYILVNSSSAGGNPAGTQIQARSQEKKGVRMRSYLPIVLVVFFTGCSGRNADHALSGSRTAAADGSSAMAPEPERCHGEVSSAAAPVIEVTSSYPGADARTVADTIAAPIEQQINGVENAVSMRSRSYSDGRYLLRVRFKEGADLDAARSLVAERVALALPLLPELVKQPGVTSRIATAPAHILMLHSPGGTDNAMRLAALKFHRELTRMDDVGKVVSIGEGDFALYIHADPKRLSAFGLTVSELTRILKTQFAASKDLTGTLGLQEFAGVVVKTGANGTTVCLRDVAQARWGTGPVPSFACLEGKPAVLLVLRPVPGVSAAKLNESLRQKEAKFKSQCPEGVVLDAFDVLTNLASNQATGDYLVLEAAFPAGASPERISWGLQHFANGLGRIPGVKSTIVLSENPLAPFGDAPCIIMRLDSAAARDRTQVVRRTGEQIRQVQEFDVTFCDLSPRPSDTLSLDMAIEDIGDMGYRAERDSAGSFAKRLRQRKEIADAFADAPNDNRWLYVDIDRERAAALGFSTDDVTTALNALGPGIELGSVRFWTQDLSIKLVLTSEGLDFVNETTGKIRAPAVFRNDISALALLQLQAAAMAGKQTAPRGESVSFADVVRVRNVGGRTYIDRLDMYSMVPLRVRPAQGVSAADAWSVCQRAANVELGKSYRLAWPWSEPEPHKSPN